MANRKTLLCWQVIRLLKSNGYFWLEFTEKRLLYQNSSTKAVRSFRLSIECVRQLKDLSGNMGRSEGDVVEVSIDRMYREEIRFRNLMISEGRKSEDNYDIGKK